MSGRAGDSALFLSRGRTQCVYSRVLSTMTTATMRRKRDSRRHLVRARRRSALIKIVLVTLFAAATRVRRSRSCVYARPTVAARARIYALPLCAIRARWMISTRRERKANRDERIRARLPGALHSEEQSSISAKFRPSSSAFLLYSRQMSAISQDIE